jgi:hypothetical protein
MCWRSATATKMRSCSRVMQLSLPRKCAGRLDIHRQFPLVPRPDMQPTQIGVSIGQVPVLLILHRQRPALWVGTKQYGTTATLRMAS